ncbi:ankyrin repeat ph and sec7 domain containing protein secg-related [Anaeramoeba flamelloides]|uniref:Ankyrin repeat ph and sec7 domain containing protein secg-related n=1 Tax=Anaeramoeba flamelloides TaxID=1746091 RepID=A0AAV7ZAB8_9EUKA|nr:ankyrin repeat ph and sec7 domain containing protein secg-related [Anaeramoeba flamelloides]
MNQSKVTKFVSILERGSLKEFKQVLPPSEVRKMFSISNPPNEELTALHLVCHYTPTPELLQYILSCGIDVNSASVDKLLTPLHILTHNQKCTLVCVKLLIRSGAKAQVSDTYGNSPLYYACTCTKINLSVIKLLLEKGCSVNYKKNDRTALHLLCLNKSVTYEALNYLISKKKQEINIVDELLRTPLICLASRRDTKIKLIKLLVQSGANVLLQDQCNCTAFHYLCRNCQHIEVDLIKLFIDRGTDLNQQDKKGFTPFLYYCTNSHINAKVIKYFLFQTKANILMSTLDLQTPLHLVCNNENSTPEILQLLIKNGCSVFKQNKQRETPIFPLINLQDYKTNMFKILYKFQTNFDHQNSDGLTPIHILTRKKKIDFYSIINFVNKFKIKLNIQDHALRTPLHHISVNPYIKDQTFVFLFNHGADPNIADHRLRTPLHWLCTKKDLKKSTLKLFFKYNANTNAQDIEGKTPLHLFLHSLHPPSSYLSIVSPIDPISSKFPNSSLLQPSSKLPKSYNSSSIAKEENMILFFLKNNADLGIKDDSNITPLQIIISNLHLFNKNFFAKVFNYLTDSLKDNKLNLNSPLSIICSSNDQPVAPLIKSFLKYNADINIKSDLSHTPLHLLLLRPKIEIKAMKLLLNHPSIHINPRNVNDNTPLHYLLKRNDVTLDIVRFFIKRGADPNCYNLDTPLSVYLNNVIVNKKLSFKEKVDILEYLVEHGAKIDKTNLNKLANKLIQTHPIIYQYLQSLDAEKEDFQNLINKEFSKDFEIHGIKFHSTLLECRLGEKLEKIKKILSKYQKEQILSLMNWVYDLPNSNVYGCELILYEFGIFKPKEKTLKNDIRGLFNKHDTKDFFIKVGNKKIMVHKIILQAKSELFRDYFNLPKNNNFSMKEYSKRSFKTMKILIRFFYYDKINQKNMDEKVLFELKDAISYYRLNPKSKLGYYIQKYQFLFENDINQKNKLKKKNQKKKNQKKKK